MSVIFYFENALSVATAYEVDERSSVGLANKKRHTVAFFGAVSPKVRVLEHGYAVRTKRHTTATGSCYIANIGADFGS